jgi:hypothetical protein
MSKSEEMVTVIPLQTIVRKESRDAPEVRHTPGPAAKPFEVPAAEAERLVRLKAAKPVAEGGAEEELRPATRAELEAQAQALGIDVGTITGTGKNGAVKNVDLENAIAAKHSENAGGRRAGNPSIVE